MAALLEYLQKSGALIPADRASIIARAQEIAPSDVGITAKEAQSVLGSML
ncbi:MAG TPA: hypothetical protein VLF65_12990 [Burkholderiales bacterium]|jgi:hypothetical protein|nr:hypothetical protein [Burkholderiales bacterium]